MHRIKDLACLITFFSIEIALTIEPEDNEDIEKVGERLPKKPLHAVQVVHGYLLQDPEETNRLTVWFTSGKLSPNLMDSSDGDFEEWKAIFDQEHKNSWSESFQNISAKLLFGAELPHSMDSDGSMSYSLSRPYGGHGKSYIEVRTKIY